MNPPSPSPAPIPGPVPAGSGRTGALARRAGRFTAATLISRVLGYARDAAVAHFFGGTALTDAFYTAFRTSNLFRRLLGEGALSSSFVPVFSKALKEEPRESVQEFLSALFTTLVCVLLLITLGGILFAPQLVRWIAPGFESSPEKFAMTVRLTRWSFPFFFFISLAALLTGVLNSLRHFFVPAVAPAMLSVAELGYIFLVMRALPPEFQILGLTISVAVGGAGHFLVQLPALFKENFRLGWLWRPRHRHTLEVGRLMGPAVLGLSVDQINAFIDTICATFLVEGSVTALYNSNRLMQLPLALFGISMATVSLPTLSEHSAGNALGAFGRTLTQALRMVVFIVLPASVGLIVLAHPVVALLFEHGRFTAFSATLTAQALVGYSAGLVGYSAVKVLANSFYALREPRTPVRVAVVCMMLDVGLKFILMGPWGVGGLAVSTAIASWGNAIWLLWLLRRRLGKDFNLGLLASTGLKSAAACAFMAGATLLAARALAPLGLFLQVFGAIAAGVAVFLAASWILKMDESRSLLAMVGFGDPLDD